MKRRLAPLLLCLVLATMSLGWRATPPTPPPPPDALINPVSMTLAANRLFVSDGYTGLHVYDVTDYSAPNKVTRIVLDENRSSAVKGDIVYTNDAGQLKALRINTDGTYTVTATIGVKYKHYNDMGFEGGTSGYGCVCYSNSFDPASSPSPTGGGSSYATFALVGNELYRVNDAYLHVYDVTNDEKPKEVSKNHVGWDIETIFPTENYLFIGGMRGMYIFDRADAFHPRQLSQIEHARACDPVVVSGSNAFITLRASGGCGSAPDELLCVNIKDPAQPYVVGVKPMTTPYGLAVQDSRLYVSHGPNGYSLVDVSSPAEPAVQATWAGNTRDFIWDGTTLFVLEKNNVAIYDVTNPLAPKLLSKVETESTL